MLGENRALAVNHGVRGTALLSEMNGVLRLERLESLSHPARFQTSQRKGNSNCKLQSWWSGKLILGLSTTSHNVGLWKTDLQPGTKSLGKSMWRSVEAGVYPAEKLKVADVTDLEVDGLAADLLPAANQSMDTACLKHMWDSFGPSGESFENRRHEITGSLASWIDSNRKEDDRSQGT